MAEASVVGQGTVVRGNVRGEGSIEIFGQVDGSVSVTGDVTLGENASVRGDVSGARISIGGSVTGDLTGSEAVILDGGAQVAGDITAPRIGIEEGARVRGALRTEEPSGSTGSRSASEPRRAPRAATEAPRQARPAAAPRSDTAAQAARKGPPAPVVPVLRGAHARKKKAKGR